MYAVIVQVYCRICQVPSDLSILYVKFSSDTEPAAGTESAIVLINEGKHRVQIASMIQRCQGWLLGRASNAT
jgi:hypothetical protein